MGHPVDFRALFCKKKKKKYHYPTSYNNTSAVFNKFFFLFFFSVVECKLSSWSEWSGCDRKCGKGVQSRSRVIVQHPSAGRPPCEPLEQKRGCMGTRCSKRDRKYKNPIRGKKYIAWYILQDAHLAFLRHQKSLVNLCFLKAKGH